MFNLKRVAGLVCVAVVTALFGMANVGTASAANESITLKTTVKPTKGKVYKTRSVPARMQLSVKVNVPAGTAKMNPLKRAVVRFPKQMTFNPNNRRTPVCTDKKLGKTSNLAAGTAGVASLCPKSIIGTGTAQIYLAKVVSDTTLVKDPQLLVFNAGKDKKGNAKIKIYAYSKNTNVGILMYGTLSRKAVINVAIPVLSNDSATTSFVLGIPGAPIKDGGKTFKGRDGGYARIKCTNGKWVSGGTFTLGERTYPAGTATGPSSTVKARNTSVKCRASRG